MSKTSDIVHFQRGPIAKLIQSLMRIQSVVDSVRVLQVRDAFGSVVVALGINYLDSFSDTSGGGRAKRVLVGQPRKRHLSGSRLFVRMDLEWFIRPGRFRDRDNADLRLSSPVVEG
jgi:hypothetical protein